jgi:monothiol glutaredoxin
MHAIDPKPELPMTDIHDTIKDQVSHNRVVLYMKGTPQFPQCGFSATVAEVLKRCGVTEYTSFNVLQDDALRQGIKEFSNWPTVPQLYVDGEFVGGCDIVREMYQTGELQQLLAKEPA